MGLVLVVGCGLAWITHRARVQQDAVAAIKRAGGEVGYDFEFEGDGSFPSPNPHPRAPRWLVNCVGVDYFGTVVQAEFRFLQATDADLVLVARLRRLEGLTIFSPKVTDDGLAHLKDLTGLRQVLLSFDPRGMFPVAGPVPPGTGAAVGDVGLARLEPLLAQPSSLCLNLSGTRVSNAGLVHLQGLAGLGYLNLSGTSVSSAGLVHLERLAGLKYLNLSGTNVSGDGLEHLQGLDDLEELHLQNVMLGDAGLSHLAGLPRLRLLNLANTDVTDADLKFLAAMPSLTALPLVNTWDTDDGLVQEVAGPLTLDLSFTQISDAGLSQLSALKYLAVLSLRGTNVTDAGVASLQKALPQLKIER